MQREHGEHGTDLLHELPVLSDALASFRTASIFKPFACHSVSPAKTLALWSLAADTAPMSGVRGVLASKSHAIERRSRSLQGRPILKESSR
jgi:hypothetical protein